MRVLNTSKMATRILAYNASTLPYAANALSPSISEETIVEHQKLYQQYAQNFTNATAAVASATDDASLRDAENSQAYNGSGYVLHSIYFSNMTPTETTPGTETTNALTQAFGSVDAFLTKLQAAANALQGPGWAILGWEPATGDVHLQLASKHQDNALWGMIPVLALDLWEHAYYLDYTIDRAAYIAAWVKLINWDDVERRLVGAQKGEIPV